MVRPEETSSFKCSDIYFKCSIVLDQIGPEGEPQELSQDKEIDKHQTNRNSIEVAANSSTMLTMQSNLLSEYPKDTYQHM